MVPAHTHGVLKRLLESHFHSNSKSQMDAGGGEVLQLHDRFASKNLPEPIWRLADGFGVAADAAEARHRLSPDAYCALVLQPCGLRSLLVAGLHPAHHVCPSVRSRLGAELTRPEPGITHGPHATRLCLLGMDYARQTSRSRSSRAGV